MVDRGARAHAVLLGLQLLVAAAGCNQSLFDAHGAGGGSGSGGGSGDAGSGGADSGGPDGCPSACLADAAAAFDGTIDGSDDHWRYLGDQRDHTWAPMLPSGNAMVGKADNRIARCADNASAAACVDLPGALLVTSSGMAAASDPAIEYTAAAARVVRLTLTAHVPGDGADHRIRLYRNSREDVLFTAPAAPSATVTHAITVDALPGDRFLVALEPTTARGGPVALRFFVSDPGQSFPATCQLAVGFADRDIVGATVDDLCRGALTSIFNTSPTPPLLITGPFPFHGMGVHVEPGYYLVDSAPLAAPAATIQFWVQNDDPTIKAVVFSDIDENNASGVAIQFNNVSGPKLEATVIATTSPLAYTAQRIDFASPDKWHFVRVVHTAGTATFCVDGARVASLPLRTAAAPGIAPYLGRNGPWNPPNELIGAIDDLRVFSDALPCE
jgi:hypothetical protein